MTADRIDLARVMLDHVRLGVELQRALDRAADECEGKTRQEVSEIYRWRLDRIFAVNKEIEIK